MKVEIKITSAEFRKMLGSSKIGWMYDELVKSMGEQGFSREEIEGFIAPLFLDALKKKAVEK